MKKLLLLLLSAVPAFAGDWYVRTTSQGSANGTSWNNAWSLANLNSSWASVQPGDTVWIAGGTYASGIVVAKSGTAGSPITIKRPLTTDAVPVASPGWSAGFDSLATFTSSSALRTPVSNLIVDGRQDMGMRFVASNSGGLPCSVDVTSGNGITLTNLDLVGPNSVAFTDGASCGNTFVNFNGDCSGVMIGYGYSPNPGADNIKVTHCRIRGHANEFWFAQARNIIIEWNRIYDNGAANSATWHGNLMIVNGSDTITFRFNEVFNWQVEGLYPWGSVSRNWWVYGNLWHDGFQGAAGSTHRFLEIRSFSGTVTHGPMYVYNNTIARCYWAIRQGDATVFWHPSTVIRNNLVYGLGGGGGIGYTTGTTADHNVTASVDPFVNIAARDYHITSGSQARNAGVTIDPVVGQFYSIDLDGAPRGNDGTWDVGAYEFATAGTNAIIYALPSSLDFGILRPGETAEQTITITNIGAGSFTGTASISAPYSIVSGANYTLFNGSNHTVTVRYTPTTQALNSGTVTMTGGGGTTTSVIGRSITNQVNYTWWFTNSLFESPWNASGNMISQGSTSDSSVPTDGSILFGFEVPTNGLYYWTAFVNAPNTSSDSFYYAIDANPSSQQDVWDVLPLTTGVQNRTVGKRGNGTFNNPQYPTNLVYLTAGDHYMRWRYREANAGLSNITMFGYSTNITGNPPVIIVQPPTLLRVILGQATNFGIDVVGSSPITTRIYTNDVFKANGTTNEIASATAADAVSYTFVSSNQWGMATSSVATVEFVVLPEITEFSQGLEVPLLTEVTLEATVIANGTLQFYWFNGDFLWTPVTSEYTPITFAVNNDTLGGWKLMVVNEAGSVTSDTVFFTIAANGVPFVLTGRANLTGNATVNLP